MAPSGVLTELQGGHAQGSGITAGEVATHAGAAQAQDGTFRITFYEEGGVKNGNETTKVRCEARSQGAEICGMSSVVTYRVVLYSSLRAATTGS